MVVRGANTEATVGAWGASMSLPSPSPQGRTFGRIGDDEVVEEFPEHVEMIAPALGLCVDLGLQRAQHGMKRIHQWSPIWRPKCSLKRASSRTKSSKRRLAAVSSRKLNQASALDDSAQASSARCARSPRVVKV